MFGALFLFTSLGSNIKISSFLVGYKFIPFLLVGLAARLGMILLIAFAFPLEDDRTFFVRSGARRSKIVYEVRTRC